MLGLILIAVLGILIAMAQPFAPGLSPLGHYVMGTVLFGLGMWIFRPGMLPFMSGVSFILGVTLALFFAFKAGLVFPGKVPFKSPQQIYGVVMGGFTSSAVWTLIPALFFGFVLQKTGLGKRIAYLVLKTFPASWLGLAISWLVIGVALSALSPSSTVRVAIVVPIAIGIVEACKLEFRSRGSAYVCLLAWGMAVIPGTGWLTGSLSGPIMQGFFPPEIKAMCNFDDWFRILALPWFVITIVYVALSYLIAKPKEAIGFSSDLFQEEYKKLGPMSKDELITMIVIILSLVMFSTEKMHGIPIPATALGALFLLILFRIITAPEIPPGINWDVVCFFGIAVALPSIFAVSGISEWLGPLIKGPIMSVAGAPLLFMLIITAGLLLIRFVDVPWGFTTCALTIMLLIPLLKDFGYHPLVVTMAYLIAINFFLLSYQQPWIPMAEGMIQGRGWAPAHVAEFGLIYVASAFISLLVSVPYWKMIGVIRYLINHKSKIIGPGYGQNLVYVRCLFLLD
ncbi:SLC13 family permease [Syntrophus gentianae]|nr:anion permease [Syntrophus gentianae]